MPRQGVLHFVVLTLLAAGAVAGRRDPACRDLPLESRLVDRWGRPFPRIDQKMPEWCWAASAEMIMNFLAAYAPSGVYSPRQCEMANCTQQRSYCCGPGADYDYP